MKLVPKEGHEALGTVQVEKGKLSTAYDTKGMETCYARFIRGNNRGWTFHCYTITGSKTVLFYSREFWGEEK